MRVSFPVKQATLCTEQKDDIGQDGPQSKERNWCSNKFERKEGENIAMEVTRRIGNLVLKHFILQINTLHAPYWRRLFTDAVKLFFNFPPRSNNCPALPRTHQTQ